MQNVKRGRVGAKDRDGVACVVMTIFLGDRGAGAG